MCVGRWVSVWVYVTAISDYCTRQNESVCVPVVWSVLYGPAPRY